MTHRSASLVNTSGASQTKSRTIASHSITTPAPNTTPGPNTTSEKVADVSEPGEPDTIDSRMAALLRQCGKPSRYEAELSRKLATLRATFLIEPGDAA